MFLFRVCVILITYFTSYTTTQTLPATKVLFAPTKHQESSIPIEEILQEVPQLAARSFRNEIFGWNKTCAQFPNALDLDINNDFWQTQRTSNGTFNLFGAYLDDRLGDNHKYVRMLAMVDRIEPIIATHCQLWAAENQTVIFAPVESYKYIWREDWGNYVNGPLSPYLISCKIPLNAPFTPASVSLVEHQCDKSTTNLRINYNKPEKQKEVAVCMKGLDFLFHDISVRLVEWFELLHILGVDKIYMYEFSNHPNVSLVLEYYQTLGKIDVTPLTLPGGLPNTPLLRRYLLTHTWFQTVQNELIPYNDCFYKHMYKYKYIALIDYDEVIMPKRAQNYSDLLGKLSAEHHNVSTFYATNAYFLDDMPKTDITDIPEYMHILQHVKRTQILSPPKYYTKGFHSTKHVVALHNHLPIHCFEECNNYQMDIEDALLHHYREDCAPELRYNCPEFKEFVQVDDTVLKYRKELQQRVTKVLKILGLIT